MNPSILLTLLEDPDQEVRESIFQWFSDHSDYSSLAQLEVIHSEISPELTSVFDDLYLTCKKHWFRENLTRFVSDNLIFDHRLLTDVLLGMNVIFPDQYHIMDTRLILDNIIEECKEVIHPHDDPWDKLSAINKVLYFNHRFAGNYTNYYQPANSDFSAMIHTKQGIPITLSMLYLVVGRHCGLEIFPAAIPRHFMVYVEQPEMMFIDCFNSGNLLNPTDVAQFLEEINIEEPLANYLLPDAYSVIKRIFQNLQYIYNSIGDEHMLTRLTDYLILIDEPSR